MKIILIGPPGSGKGTIATELKKKYRIIQISLGELIRNEIKRKSSFGKRVSGIVNRGNLIPVDMSLKLLNKRLKKPDAKKGFILDGFPRNVAQAKKFTEKIDYIINLSIPDKEIISRLSNRRVCKKCKRNYNLITLKPKKNGVCDKCQGILVQRDDDKPEVIKNRLKVYNRESKPLIRYYGEKLLNVNAHGSVKEVVNRITKLLKTVLT